MDHRLAVFRDDDARYLAAARHIRDVVFCGEQGVPPELEWDGQDSHCTHVLLFDDDQPIATGRLRLYAPQTYKIERVAVLRDCRRRGAGRAVMRALLNAVRDIEQKSGVEIILHAQEAVAGFYLQLGFIPYGGRFVEAGIPHVAMRLASPGLSRL